jgi:hypothetical protein
MKRKSDYLPIFERVKFAADPQQSHIFSSRKIVNEKASNLAFLLYFIKMTKAENIGPKMSTLKVKYSFLDKSNI